MLLSTQCRLAGLTALLLALCSCSAGRGPGLLPARLERGWERAAPVRTFGPADLYKYNNGAAGGYLAYGFVRLETTLYRKPGAAMVVDVFDMGAAKRSFGKFSAMRSPDDEHVAVGCEGVVFDGVLDFWQGPYFVRVAPAAAEPLPNATALELGRTLASRLGGRDARVPELEHFPREGLVPHSITYCRQNLLAYRSLENGFCAAYRLEGREWQAFFADYPSEAEARAALEGFRRALTAAGQMEPIREEEGTPTFRGTHRRLGHVIAATSGRRVAGVVGPASTQARARLVVQLLRAGA